MESDIQHDPLNLASYSPGIQEIERGISTAGGDQLWLPRTVRGDSFWRGTIHGVTDLHVHPKVLASKLILAT